ncbi:YihY/virulence factor BrkB family protein [Roseomonas sp. CCTCC AB2023176]|uniref:YihY/virulence factor BrkB family protein n=1 Tax=Roseomonas sp. CCTCC AB2023176 TaxID=3342640 RepID=UPI0035DB5756
MLGRAWNIIKDAFGGFVEHEAMTRGAAIACYTLFSLAPLLVVSVAIAGFFFGASNVNTQLMGQLTALVGEEGAKAIQGMVEAGGKTGSGIAAAVGIAVLLVSASGVFAELQTALNVIWRAEQKPVTAMSLVKARALSIGLVAATGFLLLVSLVVSAVIAAFGNWMTGYAPGLRWLLQIVNLLVSFLLVAGLFAAIYKVLPDRILSWRDVIVGALVTAFLFNLGKVLIALYLANFGGSYGTAGALVVVLVWVYYSAQVFLLGAEFTRAWAAREGDWRGVDLSAPGSAAGMARAQLGADAP